MRLCTLLLLCAAALCAAALFAADASAPKQQLMAWVDQHQGDLKRINHDIWTYAEVGLEEVKSSRELQEYLKANGFEVKAGVANMPTAFVASYGSGKPIIGILAEYDALPGLSQKAEPRREARPDVQAGHGCGHSMLGTASTGAAVALKHVMDENHLAGTVRLYGTPAEETLIGKIYMVRAGLFDDVDVVLAWHPDWKTEVSYAGTKAAVSAKFTFHGLPAHASVSPHMGRSALDAVELMDVGANFLREHVKEDARIHYVITNGGDQPNVVPPLAQVWYYVRADRHHDMVDYWKRLNDIAKGAALMTGTTFDVKIDTATHDTLPNLPLAKLVQRNLELVGPPQFSDADRAFARLTQEPLTPRPAKALADSIEPLPAQPAKNPGSTDVGEISWKVPTIQFTVATHSYGVPAHSWQITACGATPIGEKGLLAAAKTLALSGYDLLTSGEERAAARKDFEQRRAGEAFTSLIPEGQQPPAHIR